jgi:hypothetical protein
VICLEFRRRLYVDPHDRSSELHVHRAECEACRQWYVRNIGRERRLRRALEFPVPPGLASRILLRHAFLKSPGRGWRWRRTGALAASLLVGFAVADLLFSTTPSPSLDDDVLHHVNELAYVLGGKVPVDDAVVAALFDWMGADVRGELGEVRFANLCTIRGRRVAHLVIAGSQGPVTVLIMPEEGISRSIVVEEESRRGRIVPYRNGALAVVSERPQPLGRIEERVRSTLRWRAATARMSSGSV